MLMYTVILVPVRHFPLKIWYSVLTGATWSRGGQVMVSEHELSYSSQALDVKSQNSIRVRKELCEKAGTLLISSSRDSSTDLLTVTKFVSRTINAIPQVKNKISTSPFC